MSLEAARLGLAADPANLQMVGIAVAQHERVLTAEVFVAERSSPERAGVDALDPNMRGPHLWFHELDPPKPGRGRTHIDVSVPRDVAERRVAAALAAGGRLVADNGPSSWTIASPDNHGVDIAAWPDFEDGEEG